MVKAMQKRSFVKAGEGAIASYTFTEFATNQGFLKLYCLSLYSGASLVYSLAETALRGATPISAGWSGSPFTHDLDIDINQNMTLAGIPKMEIGYFAAHTGGTTGTVTLNIIKVRAGAETTLATGSFSANYASAPGAYDKTTILFSEIALTILSKGDKLRLEVTATTPASAYFRLGTDPTNAYGETVDSNLILPVRLQL